ncbi:hypothetical protein [Nocardia cyriacigeorgica]|uniref:hypothetical protein n=1 Tax=Nocardia cyriacigeorgica TaxID=135487 RepID=UPI00189444E5|nr:hypothetical protein [Nocardia cyriacigeorgica]MBF6161057.1 hypothetical protein [Nocardia cyriacigeorgica]MBF6199856.1 hypothetical protein [Nocardia cyriacigeorgica]
MNTDTTQISDTTDISAAILDALADGQVHRWADVRAGLPGRDDWQRGKVLVALMYAGQVHAVKVGGATLVALPLDAAAPAA